MSKHTVTAVGFALALGLAMPAWAQVQRVRSGERMAPFTLPELDGEASSFQPPTERPLVLTFLAAHQKRSERALNDLVSLVDRLRRDGHSVDLLVVISGGEGLEYFRRKRRELALETKMLIDADDALWGRLGVAVTPTTLLIDRRGIVGWVRAGHSYDFATEARARLNQALGLAAPPKGDDTRINRDDSVERRAMRHVRMAQVLAHKGQVEAGIAELKKAEALTPDAVTVRLELAQLLCRAGHAGEALAVAERIGPTTPGDRVRVMTLSGRAYRQLGDVDRALVLLTDAVALDPGSGPALYELGRVLEQQGDCEQAMKAYRRALEID